MKYSNLRAFEKHLNSAAPAHFSPIYMVLDKDRFTRKMAVDAVQTALLKDQKNRELCLKVFEGDRLTESALFDELNALSFFSEMQVIVLDLSEKPPKALTKALEEYCAAPSKSKFLLISAPSVSSSTNFYKAVEKAGIILEVAEEKGKEKEKNLIDWISSRVASKGKKIDSQASHLLVQQTGSDQALLYNELDKLFCYVDDRPAITVQDVSTLCASVNHETIWQLGEALFRRDAATALRISKALMNEGTAFLQLIRQVRNQFQTEFQVCSLLSNGGTKDDVAKLFPYMKGFILDRHTQMAQAYGLARFKKGMQNIDAIELMAKNSNTEHDLLADMLIFKLTL